MNERSQFPIIDSSVTLDWEYVTQFNDRAVKNHGQSIAMLARRGGLSWYETYCLIKDYAFFTKITSPSSAFYECYVKREYKDWCEQKNEDFVGMEIADRDIDDPVCEAYLLDMGDK